MGWLFSSCHWNGHSASHLCTGSSSNWLGYSVCRDHRQFFGVASPLVQLQSANQRVRAFENRLSPEVLGRSRRDYANWALAAAKGRKGTPGVLDVEPEWLGPAAVYISTEPEGIPLPRAKEVLLGAASYLGTGTPGMSGSGVGSNVKRISPIVDVLVEKFGPKGAGEILDARGSYLRWCVFADRLQEVLNFFEECGAPQQKVKDLLIARRRNGALQKESLVELGVTGRSMRATKDFLRDVVGCDGAEIIKCFSNNPLLFKGTSYGPNDTPLLVVDFFIDSVGMSPCDMKSLVIMSPTILGISVKKLKARLEFLQELGVPDNRVPRLLKIAHTIFSTPVETMKENLETWVTVGQIHRDELLSIVLKAPVVLVYNLSKAKDVGLKIRFLKTVLDRSVPETLEKNPMYVGYRLLRICSRTEFLRRQGVDITTESLSFINSTNENFLKKHAPAKFSLADWDAFVVAFSLSDYTNF